LAVAERVRKSVEEYPFTVKVAHPYEKVTVSLGISTMENSMKPIPELIHEADVALYRSKAMGKNRVTYYSNTFTMPGVYLDGELDGR
jgi:diguanylate cyclase (GGDEF)-like protein